MRYVDPDGRTATGVVSGWIGTDLGIPEPTDAVPWKWVGYGVAFLGAVAIDFIVAKSVSNVIDNANTNAESSNTSSNNQQASAAAPSPLPPDPDDEDKKKSANQMQQDVKKGRAPKSVERVDKANTAMKGEQDHVHFRDGNALNKNGTWKEGAGRTLTRAEQQWLKSGGFIIPE